MKGKELERARLAWKRESRRCYFSFTFYFVLPPDGRIAVCLPMFYHPREKVYT